MIKKETLEQVIGMIDASREIGNIQQIAMNSDNDNTKLAASTKLLEIVGVISNDKKKISASGSNVQLVIEE